jgi:hypothetical protein
MRAKNAQRFMLTLVPLPGTDPIRALRWILKITLRRHGMRCVDIHEEKSSSCAIDNVLFGYLDAQNRILTAQAADTEPDGNHPSK